MKVGYKIIAAILVVFVSSSLFAQEKGKTIEATDTGKELILRKVERGDSVSRKARLHLKEHRIDSTHEKKLHIRKQRSADSSRHEKAIRIKMERIDSARQLRLTSIRKHKRDSIDRRPAKNIRMKKIVVSLPCKPDAAVLLENIMHRVTILTSDDPKVMLVATVIYEGQSLLTDSAWFSKLGVSLSGNEYEVVVNSREVAIPGMHDGRRLDSVANGVPVFDNRGTIIGARSQQERNFLLYLPREAKVNIESKYADITFINNIGGVKAKLTSGVLNLLDAEQLSVNSSYARISAGKIKRANVEVSNGRFTVKAIDTLQISSANSAVTIAKVGLLHIKNSQADQYTIEEAEQIKGTKAFGNLQLTTLAGSVNLSGKNANVKIRRIKPTASNVNITTQYARLLLPTNNLKNYTVAFEGRGGNVRAPFERNAITDASFKAAVGSSYKKPTAFQLSCQDCTVDFN